MPRCPDCDAELTDPALPCPRCGATIGASYRCDACGQEFEGGDACPACGALREPATCATHADREAVARCVACGRPVCAECRASGSGPALCGDHRDLQLIDGWAQVYSTASEFEAQLLAENLRAEGIDAQIFSQRDNIFSVDVGELSIVRLLVPVWEYAHAQEVIRGHMDVEGEVVFACPSCGEAFDPGVRECTACGAPLL